MFGHHIGSLSISTLRRGDSVFEKIGTPRFGLLNNWHHARADVTLMDNDSVSGGVEVVVVVVVVAMVMGERGGISVLVVMWGWDGVVVRRWRMTC